MVTVDGSPAATLSTPLGDGRRGESSPTGGRRQLVKRIVANRSTWSCAFSDTKTHSSVGAGTESLVVMKLEAAPGSAITARLSAQRNRAVICTNTKHNRTRFGAPAPYAGVDIPPAADRIPHVPYGPAAQQQGDPRSRTKASAARRSEERGAAKIMGSSTANTSEGELRVSSTITSAPARHQRTAATATAARSRSR